MSKARWTRRAALVGASAAAAAAAYALVIRPSDRGGPHSHYFQRLSLALARAGIAQPVIVIDRQRLLKNIEATRDALSKSELHLRLVVKSLPALGLLDAIATPLGVDRYMVFNGPMLNEMAIQKPHADLLLGKPLPVKAAEQFYRERLATGRAFSDPQWLIDSHKRLQQYAALGQRLARKLRLNFELDVGLHRGGFEDEKSLDAALEWVAQQPSCEVTGLMGYDAHVPKMPSVESAYRASQAAYQAALGALQRRLPARRYTLNSAGSPTYRLHARGSVANEVSVGSAFVKPCDFEIPTLSAHVPAAFIATPVIKALSRAQIPGLERLTGARTWLDVNAARAFFIYGGHWLARPESPPGLQHSDLYGHSSNQELLMGSSSVTLRVDDFIFLRPTQSEAVLLQFGDLLVYDGTDIVERWPTLPVSA